MRKLEKQEIIDLLYGCAVVGTGGGGDLALGLAAIEKDFRQGKELFLAKPEEVPAGYYVSVPYMCGSPASLDKCGKEYARLPGYRTGRSQYCLRASHCLSAGTSDH